MNTQRILAQVIGFAAIIASFAACQTASAESVVPCIGQTKIAASYKLNKLGHREYDRGNYTRAKTYYSKAIELNPPYLAGYERRALIEFKMGNLAGGVCDYTHARPDRLLLLPTALLLVLALEITEFIPTIIEMKSCWR